MYMRKVVLILMILIVSAFIPVNSNAKRTSTPKVIIVNSDNKVLTASSNELNEYPYILKSEPKPEVTKNITISFLGDCILATYCGMKNQGSFNYMAEKVPSSYFFEKAMPIIGSDNFTIANCENVFTDSPLTEIKKDYSPAFWFKNNTKYAKILSDNSIDAVTIANNHLNDYGKQGYDDTIKALEDANVKWTDGNPVILEKNGIRIAVIGITFWGGLDNTINQLKALENKVDASIVFFHAGEEKVHIPEQEKVNTCYKLIDNGADLVIGAHPHVLQPFEEYKGKHIVYSLGNFCYGGNNYPENRTIIFQETFTFNDNSTLISQKENIIPFYVYTGKINNYQPTPIEDEKIKDNVLNFMYRKTDTLILQ